MKAGIPQNDLANRCFMADILAAYLSFRVQEAETAGARWMPVPTAEAKLIVEHIQALVAEIARLPR